MSDMELAEEIERRLGELEITINKATNFRAFGDQFNERLWPTWQEAQVEEERCRREFRLLTKIIAALRRGPERPPSGEMVMVPREPTKEMLAAMVVANVEHDKICEGEGWDGVRRSERIYRAMLSAAEAEGRKG